MSHDELHQLLGAFVLGGLDDDEQRRFTRHLRSCPTCQREAAQLSALPALLDLVTPEELVADSPLSTTAGAAASPVTPGSPTVAPALLDRVRARRRAQRWRLGIAAAVLAAVAGALGSAAGPAFQRVNEAPTSRVVAVPAPASGSAVEIALVTRAWGTQLDLVGTGLPTTGRMSLWVTDNAGYAYQVASWNGTPAGQATLSAACWLQVADIRAIEVRSADGAPVATATLT